MEDIPPEEDYQFTVGVYKDVLTSGEWPKVDNRPFSSEEEQWPSKMRIIDKISGEYSIYHKGEIRDASKSECENLEIAAAWDSHHIIDRIIGIDKWYKGF